MKTYYYGLTLSSFNFLVAVQTKEMSKSTEYYHYLCRGKGYGDARYRFPITAPHTPVVPLKQFKEKNKAGIYGDNVCQ